MGGEFTPRPLFLLPFPNRLELVNAPIVTYWIWIGYRMALSDHIWHVPGIQNGGRKTGNALKSAWIQVISTCIRPTTTNQISTATPTFGTMPDSDMQVLTLSDISRYPDSKWRPRKPEVEITHQLFPLPISWPTFWDPDLGRCLAMTAVLSESGMVENEQGIRSKRFASSFLSSDISTSRLLSAILSSGGCTVRVRCWAVVVRFQAGQRRLNLSD